MRVESSTAAGLLTPHTARPSEPASSFESLLSQAPDKGAASKVHDFTELGVLGAGGVPSAPGSAYGEGATAPAGGSDTEALLALSPRTAGGERRDASIAPSKGAPSEAVGRLGNQAQHGSPREDIGYVVPAAPALAAAVPPTMEGGRSASIEAAGVVPSGAVAAALRSAGIISAPTTPNVEPAPTRVTATLKLGPDPFDLQASDANGALDQSERASSPDGLQRSHAQSTAETSVLVCERGGAVEVVAAAPGLTGEDRLRLRRAVDGLTSEFGLRTAGLSINGTAEAVAPRLTRRIR